MKRLIIIFVCAVFCIIPARADDFVAPTVPDSGQEWMPEEPESFSQGLWELFRKAVSAVQPAAAEAAGLCLKLIGIVMLASLIGASPADNRQVISLLSAAAIGYVVFERSNAMVILGDATITQLSEYGKLLMPVMTASLAAQGGSISAAALYAGTAFFDAMLCSMISGIIVPMVYIFLCLGILNSAIGIEVIQKMRDLVKWLITWSLKIVLYLFTGYLSITGVVSGSADAAALKAAKLTISGVVPVVGNILSDASDAVLAGAAVVKNTAGVYGLLAVIAVSIGPFVQIGTQYLMLKITAAICTLFGEKQTVGLIQDFSGAMGLLLAMTGTVCLLLLISTVCFMKGMS